LNENVLNNGNIHESASEGEKKPGAVPGATSGLVSDVVPCAVLSAVPGAVPTKTSELGHDDKRPAEELEEARRQTALTFFFNF